MSTKEEKKTINQVIDGKGEQKIKRKVQSNINLEEKISKKFQKFGEYE